MNSTALSTAISATSALVERLKERRDEKAREAYSALETAAARMEERDGEWFP